MAYPGGESRRQAVRRNARLLRDLPTRWAGQRVMLIGHVATQHALEHVINGVSLAELTATRFAWREQGWEYRLDHQHLGKPQYTVGAALLWTEER